MINNNYLCKRSLERRESNLSIADYIAKFVRFLSDSSWNKSLLNPINTFLSGNYSLSEIDSLMMSVTKTVEKTLENAIARRRGSPVPRQYSYGIRLLNYALSCNFIKNKNEPIFSLLY